MYQGTWYVLHVSHHCTYACCFCAYVDTSTINSITSQGRALAASISIPDYISVLVLAQAHSKTLWCLMLLHRSYPSPLGPTAVHTTGALTSKTKHEGEQTPSSPPLSTYRVHTYFSPLSSRKASWWVPRTNLNR